MRIIDNKILIICIWLWGLSMPLYGFPLGQGILGTSIFGDSDDDLLSDSYEVEIGSDIFKKDTDSDGLPDGTEVSIGTNPLLADSDLDGYADSEEIANDGDPLDANSTPVGGLNLMLIKAALDIKKAKEEAGE